MLSHLVRRSVNIGITLRLVLYIVVVAAVPGALIAVFAFSDIARTRNAIIIATVIFLVLLIFAAALISRRATRPLRVLSADATQTEVVEAERAPAPGGFTENNVLQFKKLSQLGLTITSASAIKDLVETCPSAIRQLTSADACAIVLLDSREHACNLDHTLEDHSYPIAMMTTDDRLEWLFSNATLVEFQKSHPEDYPDSGPALGRFAHIIDVPLLGDTGEATGAVIIANQFQDHSFSEQDAELTRIIAGYISASIQKLRTNENLQQSELRAVQALSDLENAQGQRLQSQKMESMARLAGGIAHDFNNLLTPIMGYAQLSAMHIPSEHENIRTDLHEIEKMAIQGADFTRQLLAFSGRQIIEPTAINLNTLVLDMDRMLRRVIGEDIELVAHTSDRAENVRVDPSQFDQVVMNLVVNARDAMPRGGRIDLEIKNVNLGTDFSRRNPDVQPGDYVVLSVTDTGTGIPDHVKPHVFEPFYTTKLDGTGAGLGLATCYGIVKQHGGHIEIESTVDQGTSVSIYLPRITSETPTDPASVGSSSEMPRGTETVLLVEDDTAVRNLAARVLSDQGYTVLKASNGAEALQIAESMSIPQIDLLLTDVIMPIMGGKEIADRLTAMRPDLKVLFTSGYTDDTIARQGILKPGTEFTHKPFSPLELAKKVREVLDGPHIVQTR